MENRPKTPLSNVVTVVIALAAIMASGYWIFLRNSQDQAKKPDAARVNFVIQKADASDIRYVAIGDSYTFGEGAGRDQAWPAIMTNALRAKGVKITLVANLGVSGWTTQDAIDKELPVYETASPQFATLMIGVNDSYRQTTAEQYQAQLRTLMDRMQAALPDKTRLVVVTIPNYFVTPYGKPYELRDHNKEKVPAFNKIIQEEAAKRGATVVDLYKFSEKMGSDRSLVAADQLHPSAKGYAQWAEQITPAAYKLLTSGAGR
jgi:lysophospholipase L1-like esterase